MNWSAPISIPISALQHFIFCPRQCLLIHLEQIWTENYLTAFGRVVHEKTDFGITESRGVKKTLRSLHISSETLHIHGLTDVVEINYNEDKNISSVIPIEYKSGEPKVHHADQVQLCAQALCLEEMFHISIPEAFLYYFKRKHRYPVLLDDELRNLTKQTICDLRSMLEQEITPPPSLTPSCKSCSLLDDCMPNLCSEEKSSASSRLSKLFESVLSDTNTEEEI
jgi:CRISPR-associated exonuclease Cas4